MLEEQVALLAAENADWQYPGEDGHGEYCEGLYIGYRHVNRAGLVPLFSFGFRLTFTIFDLGNHSCGRIPWSRATRLPFPCDRRAPGRWSSSLMYVALKPVLNVPTRN